MKTKNLILSVIFTFTFFSHAEKAQAATFVDNTVSCNNSSTYNPATRNCSGGNDKVYTSLNNAHMGISAGSSRNPTVINIRSGTYVERLDIYKAWTTWRKYPSDLTKPILTASFGIYTGWEGLLNLRVAGITIDGIEVSYTGFRDKEHPDDNNGSGIYVRMTSDATIANCYIHHIGNAAIHVNDSDNILITDNEIYEANYSKKEAGASWSGGIYTVSSNHITIRRNKLHGIHGEGMNLSQWGEDFIIEYNVLYDIARPAIFINQIRDVDCRYNLVYHTRNSRYVDFGGSGSFAISVHREVWWGGDYTGYGTNIDIYGNFTVGCRTGLSIGADGKWIVSNTRVYNNTFVEADGTDGLYWGMIIWNNNENPDTDSNTVEIMNNIFWQTNGQIAEVRSGAKFSNNLWSKAPPSKARASSDPTFSLNYPTLSVADYFKKQSGWTSIAPDSLTGAEFALRPTAANAIGKGANLGAPYNQLLNLSTSNFKTNTFNLIDQNSQGAWEIGAMVYGGASGAVCGNLSCDSQETNVNCPADCPNGTIIPITNWTCVADSEETSGMNGSCQNAIDGNVDTSWHTSWTGNSPYQPHNIDINLGATFQISGLRYIPRQVDGTNGIVTQYEIYVSSDGTNWGSPISQGTWTYQNKEAKDLSFAPRSARHIRFKSLDDNTHHWTSVAEILFLGGAGDGVAPASPGGLSVR